MIRKLLLTAAFCSAISSAHAASGILNWTIPPAPAGQTLTAIQIFDQVAVAGFPAPNIMFQPALGPAATTFTTPQLAAGVHTFTAVLVYGANSGAPSNSAVLTVTVTLPSITNLTVTPGP